MVSAVTGAGSRPGIAFEASYQGGAGMLSGEMARYQIADRHHEAEADRVARSTRRSKAVEARSFTRRIGRAAIAAAVWPVKH